MLGSGRGHDSEMSETLGKGTATVSCGRAPGGVGADEGAALLGAAPFLLLGRRRRSEEARREAPEGEGVGEEVGGAARAAAGRSDVEVAEVGAGGVDEALGGKEEAARTGPDAA